MVEQGYAKRPTYGVEGTKTAQFCAQHIKGGMVDVSKKRCAEQVCTKRPTFGVEGTKAELLCAHHCEKGMAAVIQKEEGVSTKVATKMNYLVRKVTSQEKLAPSMPRSSLPTSPRAAFAVRARQRAGVRLILHQGIKPHALFMQAKRERIAFLLPPRRWIPQTGPDAEASEVAAQSKTFYCCSCSFPQKEHAEVQTPRQDRF